MKRFILWGLMIQLCGSTIAQQTNNVVPKYFQLRDNLYIMKNSYTNIGIFVGDNELLLLDASMKDLIPINTFPHERHNCVGEK